MAWTPRSKDQPPAGTPIDQILQWSEHQPEAYASWEKEQLEAFAWVEPAPPTPTAVPQAIDRLEVERQVDADERNPRHAANRSRATRGNMLRRLRRHFHSYEPFTPHEAATRAKYEETAIRMYLEKECQLYGSHVRQLEDGRFMLLTGFE